MNMMNTDAFMELVKSRRTVRRFKPDPFPDEWLYNMLEVARWSPSGANGQPWEFIIIKDQKMKDKMAECYLEIRPEHFMIEQTRIPELRHHQTVTKQEFQPGFKDAPVLIMVCGDRRTFQASVLGGRFFGSEMGLDGTYQKNIGNAVYGIMLTARTYGLGTQWLTVANMWGELIKPLLGVPPQICLQVCVPVGYPLHEPAPSWRRDLKEMIHYEKYEMSKFRTGVQVIDFIRQLRGHTKPAYDQEKKVSK